MSLRLRLAVAFLLLSALPLAGFAVWSYANSRAALRQVAQAEADNAAHDLEQRVASAAEEIGDRFRALSRLPASGGSVTADKGKTVAVALEDLGPALDFVDNLEFIPAPPDPPSAGEMAHRAVLDAKVQRIVVRGGEEKGAELPAAAEMGLQWAQFGLSAAEMANVRADVAKSIAEARRAIAEAEKNRRGIEAAAPVAAVAPLARVAPTPAVPPVPAIAPAAPPAPPSPAAAPARAPRARVAAPARMLLANGEVFCSLSSDGKVVGRIQGKVKAATLLRSVLAESDRERGEIPFAIDRDGNLYTANPDDLRRLEKPSRAASPALGRRRPPSQAESDWVVLSRHDEASGYQFGIARPLGKAIAALRAAAARNFAFGLGLVALAMTGFFPLTHRIVRDVRELESGARQLAAGDLATRVAVRGQDEIGRLAGAFNRMAEQIATHQEQLLAEERRRKEDEIARRLLAAENERRGRELEEARQFQLSLLPRELPRLDGLAVAVEMTTATEVGGDYYDFQEMGSGLVVAIGDATGHGAAAGTLVTAVKSLFAAGAGTLTPAAFLVSANAAIHRMGLVRRAMALAVARVEGERVTLSSAGMPPVFHFRAASGETREIALAGTPLGARADFPYAEATLELAPGDALLFASDGLPELPNGDGEPFGYERLRALFAASADAAAEEIVARLSSAATDWGGDRPPVDDVTLLVLKATTAVAPSPAPRRI